MGSNCRAFPPSSPCLSFPIVRSPFSGLRRKLSVLTVWAPPVTGFCEWMNEYAYFTKTWNWLCLLACFVMAMPCLFLINKLCKGIVWCFIYQAFFVLQMTISFVRTCQVVCVHKFKTSVRSEMKAEKLVYSCLVPCKCHQSGQIQ